MNILVTGAAGFIGFHCCQAMLTQGWQVWGLDNLNDYYDVGLKQSRLNILRQNPAFHFLYADLNDQPILNQLLEEKFSITHVLHLAAQAGVRYSLQNPQAYAHSNLTGHLAVLEFCRHLSTLQHLVYASSSSVYGANTNVPFSVEDRVEQPVSLYAATKRADEIMSYTYSHLYGIPVTGLRFFTVYGPYGRPDMAYFSFTKAIMDGVPIKLFNNGKMKRDFTHIDDIVQGVLAALQHPLTSSPPHRLFNLGNNKPVELLHFVQVIERAVGKKAIVEYAPMQPGDVIETFADIAVTTKALGFMPKVAIEEGIPRFVEWYKGYV